METKNDFIKLREVVKEAVTQYTKLRKEIDWKDPGKSATIQRLAKPFLEGYFTIAVAGKMSAGKSTFINSLIGENLLPTGHFQTTNSITWIVSSDKRLMEVTYADGHTKIYNSTANFAKELRNLVAVPTKYDTLPINHINNLIKGDDGIVEILKKKDGIEQLTKTHSNEKLWKEYVKDTPKSKIADKVIIYLPLPKEYEGWRIVDTPGVGAVGGIQDETKKLLTAKDDDDITKNIVDAVILLHKGSDNIQDEGANEFAEEVSKSMGNLAKGRLFFVLTHACSTEFTNYKEKTLNLSSNLFGKRLDIPKEKITYVDSLIQRFITDAKKSGRDFSVIESLIKPFENWSKEEWSVIAGIVYPLFIQLSSQGKELSNSTLFSTLEEMANFEELRNMLYEFLNTEKERTFSDLMELIEKELEHYSARLKNDKKAVSNGKPEIEAQIKRAEDEKVQLDKALSKLKQKAAPGVIKGQFEFIKEELSELSNKKSIAEVRTAYLQIKDKGIKAEKNFFISLKNDFKEFVSVFNDQNLTFESLDLDELEMKAENVATSTVTDRSRPVPVVVKEAGWSSSAEYKTTYPYTKNVVDFNKKRREFTAFVIEKGKTLYDIYIKNVQDKAENFFKCGKVNIEEKTENTKKRLKGFEQSLANKDEIIKYLDEQLNAVELAKRSLEKYYKD